MMKIITISGKNLWCVYMYISMRCVSMDSNDDDGLAFNLFTIAEADRCTYVCFCRAVWAWSSSATSSRRIECRH